MNAPQRTALEAAPALALRVLLVVTEGPHQGRTFTFDRHDTFVVGRAPEVHFSLPEKDPYFSRVHFLVEVNPSACRLLDLNSRNGTLVNGRRVQSADLRDGDEIRGGTTALRVRLLTAGGPGETLGLPAAPASVVPVTASSYVPSAEVATLPPRATPAGPAVPGYRIMRELGQGGMGIVYEAVREADGTTVALKTVLPAARPTPAALQRFLREADILRQLEHPHIVAFHDLGEVDGLRYFAMEFVDGVDAGQLLDREGPLPIGRAVRLTCQLLEALAYAHGRGFVHRDVKPGNLLVAGAGGAGERLRLADFGLARTYQVSQLSGLTISECPGGTPRYMPPEQVLDFRSAKPPADQYAAAAALYNLLTNDFVHGRDDSVHEMYKKILTADPVPLRSRRPDVPAELAAAVHKALARKPEDLFPDVPRFGNGWCRSRCVDANLAWVCDPGRWSVQ
jgi:serine/threonine-protein kinase